MRSWTSRHARRVRGGRQDRPFQADQERIVDGDAVEIIDGLPDGAQ